MNSVKTDNEGTQGFASGATSSGMKTRFDLIPSFALQRIAKRFELGAQKYGENNWEKGIDDADFMRDRLNHAFDHLIKISQSFSRDDLQDLKEDELAAVILNCIFLMAFEETRRFHRSTLGGLI